MVTLATLSLPAIIRMVPPDTSDDFREACPWCEAKIQPDKLSAHIAAQHRDKSISLSPPIPPCDSTRSLQERPVQPTRRSKAPPSLANKPQPIIQIKPRKKIVLTAS